MNRPDPRRDLIPGVLADLRAMAHLAGNIAIQFRSLRNPILKQARYRSTSKYPGKGEKRGWCEEVWLRSPRSCNNAHTSVVRETVRKAQPACVTCPGGLQILSMPIISNGQVQGILSSSQRTHLEDGGSFDRAYAYVRNIPRSRRHWLSLYGELNSAPKERVLGVLKIARSITEAVLALARIPAPRHADVRVMSGSPGSTAFDWGTIQTGKGRLPRDTGLIERARLLLKRNPKAGLSLHAAAAALHCSPLTLTRRFKRATGMSIPAYANLARIELAKDLLGNSALSVMEISQRAGFGTNRHFRREFKRVAGMSPIKFRRTQWLNRAPPGLELSP